MSRKPARRREPTPKQEGEQIIESAAKAGTDYAKDQVGGEYFRDWVYEQIAEAERMRQRDPNSVFPTDTPAGAREAARNMLQQLEWDTKRQLDEREILEMAGAKGVFGAGSDDWVRDHYGITRHDVTSAFFDAFIEELRSTTTRAWLTDLVLETSEQVRGVPTSKAHRKPGGIGASEDTHAYNIEVFYPDERFARKHESQIGHIIGQPLVSQGALRDGYRMEYGPIDRGDYRRLEGLIYSKLGNAVRVNLVQVMYGGLNRESSSGRDHERRALLDVLARRGSVHPEMAAQLVDRYQRLGVGPAELRRRLTGGESPLEIAQMPADRRDGRKVDPQTWAETRGRSVRPRRPVRR